MSAPYYQDERVTLYHGDWRELIPEDFTADLILTDPPYGETSLEWDKWPTGWPALAARHSRSMWCFGSMRMFLDNVSDFADWRLSQDVVWDKGDGSCLSGDRFMRVHEFALHWYRGEWSAIHHEQQKVEHYGRRTNSRRGALAAHVYGSAGAVDYTDDGSRLMQSVMQAPNLRGRSINATEKPVPILEPLIRYGCPPGGTVLDLFAGSTATLVAARNLDRFGVGYELREEQCETAALRLSQQILDFGEGA